MKIGIDIGGSHVAVGLIDMYGQMICKSEEELHNNLETENCEKILVDAIIRQIAYVLEKNNTDITKVKLIGIAVPGMVSDTSILKAENLHIKDFNITREINKYYNVPTKLRNDAKCAALAERGYGSLKKAQDSIFVTIGTGIGGAVFLGGELLVPKKYEGFEIGHMVIKKNGIKCNCGRNGCFERYASMRFLKQRIAEELKKDNISWEELKDIIENNDNKKISIIVDEYIEDLSLGLANLINVFEPQSISIGGSFAYYNVLLEKLKNKMHSEELFNKKNPPKIMLAKLKNDAGIIGAVL